MSNSSKEAREIAKKMFDLYLGDQTFEHDGDCTNKCHTCFRCIYEETLKPIAEALKKARREVQKELSEMTIQEFVKWRASIKEPEDAKDT